MARMMPVESSLDRVMAAIASKLLVLVPPWLLWPVIGGLGAAMHGLFGASVWSVLGLLVAVSVLTLVTWLASHGRGWLGRGSAVTTTAAAALWVTVCSVTGFTHPVTLWAWLVGGATLCASWNIRCVIRDRSAGSGGDTLALLFDGAKDKANLDGAKMKTVEASGRKIEAAMALPAGQKTVADVQKRAEYLEGAMGLPPGAMTISADLDHAAKAKVTISDPRILRNPIPWPGPSRPGGSIAEMLRVGVWQDGDDTEFTLPGVHLQVMGMSGSGKSLGAGWNALGEIITRNDSAVFGFDISKGEQTLGHAREGLHTFDDTIGSVSARIRKIEPLIKARTDYLSAAGYTAWEPGCGLAYWILWFEEVAKIFNKLTDKDQESLLEIIKEIRSAGGTVVMSLQRADWTQMPTLVRGQLAKWCFGVESSGDAAFGLSEAQDDAGARPELWGIRYPGMAYLDAPSVDEARIAMPLRTYLWSKDGQQMRDLCAQFPAAAKTVDEFTAAVVGADQAFSVLAAKADEGQDDEPDEPDEDWSPADDITTPDPDPDLTEGTDVDSPITDPDDDEEWEFERPKVKPPLLARQQINTRIRTWAEEGRTDFSTADLADIWTSAGMSRAWAQKTLKALRDEGVIGYDDERQRHVLVRVSEPV